VPDWKDLLRGAPRLIAVGSERQKAAGNTITG